MSQIMEKTLASLPKLLSQSLTGNSGSNKSNMTTPRRQPPMDVQQFMKQMHKARSKAQEVELVKAQVLQIKEKLKTVSSANYDSVVRASLTKVIFCHQLGHDVKGMALEAIKLAQQGEGFNKSLGYLVSCLLLHPQDELALLMTSTIIKDLKSRNMTENCLALKAAGEIICSETVPHLLPQVIGCFTHRQDLVKEKAIHCFRCFYLKAPDLLKLELPKLSQFLSSRDPGVLMSVTHMFVILTEQSPSRYTSLSTSFMHILDQINSRAFGSVYYHHMVPLPWLQINLLKVLSNLALCDNNVKIRLEPILKTLIEKTKVSVPISLAILVESIQTAAKIHASETLLQLCSRCIMKLMSSDSSEDMRYQGLGLLISLARIKPSYASQHQAAVMDCLTSADPAIQSRTTFLLHAMANAANVKVICEKLFEQYDKLQDDDLCVEILDMILNLIDKFSSDVAWYISTNFRVLSCSHGSQLKQRISNSCVKRLEKFTIQSQLGDSDMHALSLIQEEMLTSLENINAVASEHSIKIRILGVVIPLIPQLFQCNRFMGIITACVFGASDNDNNVLRVPSMMKELPAHILKNTSFDNDKNENGGDDMSVKVQCVDTVLKLVLTECINCETVLKWLEENYHKDMVQDGSLRGVFQELEQLAKSSTNLKLRSKIIFQTPISELDLSLSFLDSLVVRDMLNGGLCYEPKYIKEGEKMRNDFMANSTLSSQLGDDLVMSSMSHSMPMSQSQDMVKSSRSRKVKERWRDNEQMCSDSDDNEQEEDTDASGERFLLVDAEGSAANEEAKRKLTADLFAGFDDDHSAEPKFQLTDSGISNSVIKPQIKTHKNMWDDDDDVEDDNDDGDMDASVISGVGLSQQNFIKSSSNIFNMDLHPFGITKKHPPNLWHDGESDGDQIYSPDCFNQDNFQYSITSDTSLYAHPVIDKDNDDIMTSSDAANENFMISGQLNKGVSIYSESECASGNSPVLVSPDLISVSAIDTLTDSDPDAL